MVLRLVIAGFLMAHALVHAGFVSRRPPPTPGAPTWPFELGYSWLLSRLGVDPGVLRAMGAALFVLTVVGYGVASLAALGVLDGALWLGGIATGTIASLALLLLFFHPWLVLGVAIDVAVAWIVLRSGWTPAQIGS